MRTPSTTDGQALEQAVLGHVRQPLQRAGIVVALGIGASLLLLEGLVWLTGDPSWRLPLVPRLVLCGGALPTGLFLWWRVRSGVFDRGTLTRLFWAFATIPAWVGALHAVLDPGGLVAAVQGMLPVAIASIIVLSALQTRPLLPVAIAAACTTQYLLLFAIARTHVDAASVGPDLALALTSWGEALRRAAFLMGTGAFSGLLARAFREAVGSLLTARAEQDKAERAALRIEFQRAAAQAASTAKGEFVATLTHELRTPTHGILGRAEALAGAPSLPLAHRTEAQHIVTSTHHLLALIEDALDDAAVAAGRIAVSPQAVVPDALLASVEDLLQATDPEAGVPLRWVVEPTVPPSIHVDPRRLKQVLINLVRNALKHSQQGGVHVEVRADGTDHVVFDVRDSGPGLPADQIDRLLGRFERGANTTAEGHGLGLAITRRLLDAMGGSLVLSNLPKGGAQARVRLPICAEQASLRPVPAVFPDPHARAHLRAAAERGDMRDLADRCQALRAQDPTLVPFADQVLALAAQYDDEAVIALLDRAPCPSEPRPGP